MIETKLTNEQMSNLSINTENEQDSSLTKLRLFSTLGVFRPDTNNREGEQTLMMRKKKKLRRGGRI